ncbi:MAG: FtsX-like permease family protein, partial [Syntrophomonadaceae bacterium]|nr:FtsX-like permease family protein [Syntrophomonadaceae bacterium]
GIRMAIRATTRAILNQFLIESLLLCGIGGILGLLFGWGTASILSALADLTIKVTPWLIAVALGFAVIIGVFFGFYPAHKAANLNPIDALRFE